MLAYVLFLNFLQILFSYQQSVLFSELLFQILESQLLLGE